MGLPSLCGLQFGGKSAGIQTSLPPSAKIHGRSRHRDWAPSSAIGVPLAHHESKQHAAKLCATLKSFAKAISGSLEHRSGIKARSS